MARGRRFAADGAGAWSRARLKGDTKVTKDNKVTKRAAAPASRPPNASLESFVPLVSFVSALFPALVEPRRQADYRRSCGKAQPPGADPAKD